MNDYLSFKREMNNRDLEFNKRWSLILLIIIIFMIAVFIMNIYDLYLGQTSWFRGFSCGMILFCILSNSQQLSFIWSDYKYKKKIKSIYDEIEDEKVIRNVKEMDE
jgi:hypothetical protein